MEISRKWSFVILLAIYAVAAAIAYIIYVQNWAGDSVPWNLFLADVAATVFVWAWGLVFRNVSVYDPYWSVAPPLMLSAYAFGCGSLSVPSLLLLIAVWYWALRLTGNWAFTFRGLAYEDWRYTKYRVEKPAFIFQVINFFGLNMMPTVVVFLCILPGIGIIGYPDAQAGILTWVGFAVCVGAATIQLIADTQAHGFRREHKGEVCCTGLWAYGRHPNYFGEIMMWWGVWVIFVSVFGLKQGVCMLGGPVAMTAMFRFISVPLMEKRQLQNKPAYKEYRERTRMFI